MIYVGISPYKNEDGTYCDLIKIGYTKDENRDKRLLMYTSHNPSFKFVYKFVGGTEDQEHRLHYKFRDYIHHGNEWFRYSGEIMDYFKTSTLQDFSKLPINPNFIGKCSDTGIFSLRVQVMLENILVFLEGVTWRNFIENSNLLRDKFSYLIPDDLQSEGTVEEIWKWLLNSGHFPKLQDKLLEEFWKESSNDDITNFISTFESKTLGKEKMKFLCEFLPHHKDIEEEILMNIPLAYKNYYLVLGPERCWQFSYQMSKLEEEYQRQLSTQRVSLEDIQKIIYDTFQEGERYTKSDLKKAIQGIYDSLGLKKTGKANDFEYWFKLKRCNIIDSVTKKKKEGFELLKKKF